MNYFNLIEIWIFKKFNIPNDTMYFLNQTKAKSNTLITFLIKVAHCLFLEVHDDKYFTYSYNKFKSKCNILSG